MTAKVGIWLVWVFAVLFGLFGSIYFAVPVLSILAMVVFSPALFVFPWIRRTPLAAQLFAAVLLGAYAAWVIVDKIL